MRTANGNLPVYTDIRNGRTKLVTIVRKYRGDVEALADELQTVCGGSKVTPYHGRLEVHGRHTAAITSWLKGLGF